MALYPRASVALKRGRSSATMQAQILFLKSPQLPPVRDAVNAAVECRHAQVCEPWAVTLGCFGVRRNQQYSSVQKVMGVQAKKNLSGSRSGTS